MTGQQNNMNKQHETGEQIWIVYDRRLASAKIIAPTPSLPKKKSFLYVVDVEEVTRHLASMGIVLDTDAETEDGSPIYSVLASKCYTNLPDALRMVLSERQRQLSIIEQAHQREKSQIRLLEKHAKENGVLLPHLLPHYYEF